MPEKPHALPLTCLGQREGIGDRMNLVDWTTTMRLSIWLIGRVLPFVLSVVLMTSQFALSHEDDEVDKSIAEKYSQLNYENSKIGDHEWAGTYVQPHGEETFLSFIVAPSNTAAFRILTNDGISAQGVATVKVSDSVLHLSWEKATVPLESLETQLLMVRYSSKLFLVPPRQVHAFCLQRDDYLETHYCLVRREQTPPSQEQSIFKLPHEYERFENLPAIVAKVTDVERGALFTNGGNLLGKQGFTIDKGSMHGILLGALFETSGKRKCIARVREVSENSSVAEYENGVDPKRGFEPIRVGQVFQTNTQLSDFVVFRNGHTPKMKEFHQVTTKAKNNKLFPDQ